MSDENDDLVPQKQSLFPMTADDIVDNALQNLDQQQAKEVTKKAAGEVVKIAVEKRKAEYRSDRAQEEMRNLIFNANLLDKESTTTKSTAPSKQPQAPRASKSKSLNPPD